MHAKRVRTNSVVGSRNIGSVSGEKLEQLSLSQSPSAFLQQQQPAERKSDHKVDQEEKLRVHEMGGIIRFQPKQSPPDTRITRKILIPDGVKDSRVPIKISMETDVDPQSVLFTSESSNVRIHSWTTENQTNVPELVHWERLVGSHVVVTKVLGSLSPHKMEYVGILRSASSSSLVIEDPDSGNRRFVDPSGVESVEIGHDYDHGVENVMESVVELVENQPYGNSSHDANYEDSDGETGEDEPIGTRTADLIYSSSLLQLDPKYVFTIATAHPSDKDHIGEDFSMLDVPTPKTGEPPHQSLSMKLQMYAGIKNTGTIDYRGMNVEVVMEPPQPPSKGGLQQDLEPLPRSYRYQESAKVERFARAAPMVQVEPRDEGEYLETGAGGSGMSQPVLQSIFSLKGTVDIKPAKNTTVSALRRETQCWMEQVYNPDSDENFVTTFLRWENRDNLCGGNVEVFQYKRTGDHDNLEPLGKFRLKPLGPRKEVKNCWKNIEGLSGKWEELGPTKVPNTNNDLVYRYNLKLCNQSDRPQWIRVEKRFPGSNWSNYPSESKDNLVFSPRVPREEERASSSVATGESFVELQPNQMREFSIAIRVSE